MEEIKIEAKIKVARFDELSDEDRELVEQAKDATRNSYAKYSHFRVGAAIRLGNGIIQIGANQENAAFPSGLCAERSAVFAAQSMFPEQPVKALAIAARNEEGFLQNPISPCGACRQVILEMEDRYKSPVRLLLYGEKHTFCLESIRDILPLSFVDECMHS